ncbi:MAG: EscU/YscU/HrcU family type III secretion system export apparatus switch protein [Desulfosarcinaceae bacterium]
MSDPKVPDKKRAVPKSGRRSATALRYDAQKSGAPEVVATGRGALAERIIALAEAHDIPLVSDPGLAQTLAKLEVDTEIPPELYLAVAQILAYLYRLDREGGPPTNEP